ncbi:MAG: PKD domain-containing protein [Chitinophagaceae bacterium]|nr:PKD domain-containing protein [Chitinophagaceae bacterium]
MIKNKISMLFAILFTVIAFSACKKAEYSIGDIVAPTNLVLTATVVGVDASNPFGNGTGKVNIAVKADYALTYKIDFGDGNAAQMVPSGVITYKYGAPGTAEYNITVNAIGTAGSTSTITKKVKVFVNFTIPANILSNLTGGSSKVWQTDHDAPGHFGVGPNTEFSPIWYSATPNSREACAYDDDITFSKDANDNVSLSIDNKGASFSIGAATAFYGFAGGDGCYGISTGGVRRLTFMDATSTSTPAQSTRIQFTVPGNGIINFGTGGTTYEILSISATQIHLRNIGVDGNSWYQKLIKK